MRKKILAGNWKMNKTSRELKAYFEVFLKETKSIDVAMGHDFELMFGVPFPYLQEAVKASQGKALIAAQNLHFEKSGAFTGEVSCEMLRDIGIHSAIIGHSERRQYFGDTNEIVALKTKAALASEILPVICLGEKKEERVSGMTFNILKSQLEPVLQILSPQSNVVIAYEPVWAIGTGLTATESQAQDAHAFIRQQLSTRLGQDFSNKTRILYGGSVNLKNVENLLSQPDIDGGLVGGASLNPEEFAHMAIITSKLSRR